ncbi:MAG TPA: hypothetical protein VIC84_07790 [Blastocatellia bacterium]
MSDTTTTNTQLERFQGPDASSTGVEPPSAAPHSGPTCGAPPCCGTGCAVCVLDYWEPDESESETLAMLDAIEQAQSQAQRMIADLSDPIE